LNAHIEKTILLRSKILLDTDLKIILLAHQNNFVRILKMTMNKTMSIAAKNLIL